MKLIVLVTTYTVLVVSHQLFVLSCPRPVDNTETALVINCYYLL